MAVKDIMKLIPFAVRFRAETESVGIFIRDFNNISFNKMDIIQSVNTYTQDRNVFPDGWDSKYCYLIFYKSGSLDCAFSRDVKRLPPEYCLKNDNSILSIKDFYKIYKQKEIISKARQLTKDLKRLPKA